MVRANVRACVHACVRVKFSRIDYFRGKKRARAREFGLDFRGGGGGSPRTVDRPRDGAFLRTAKEDMIWFGVYGLGFGV